MSKTTRCSLYLVALRSSLKDFQSALGQAEPKPFVAANVIHWVARPEKYSVDSLLKGTPPWSIALIYTSPSALPESLTVHISRTWTIDFDAYNAFLESYTTTTTSLAAETHTRSHELDQLTNGAAGSTTTAAAGSQSLEITPELLSWMLSSAHRPNGTKPIAMLNLHAYRDVEKYGQYRTAFNAGPGARHGAKAKLFGQAAGPASDGETHWDLVALVHYPSALHFGDMLASADYQEISHKYRTGSLWDNPLLCLSEFPA